MKPKANVRLQRKCAPRRVIRNERSYRGGPRAGGMREALSTHAYKKGTNRGMSLSALSLSSISFQRASTHQSTCSLALPSLLLSPPPPPRSLAEVSEYNPHVQRRQC